MNKHVKKAQKLYDKFVALHKDVYDFISESSDDVKAVRVPLEALTDMGFLCREMENFMDELRKEVKFRKELCGKIISVAIAKQNLEDPLKVVDRVEGELASGTPDIKLQAKLPSKGSDEFYQLLDFLEIPRDMADGTCFKLSWSGMADLVTQLAEDGRPLPPGVEKSWPLYSTIFRRRKLRKSKDATDEDEDL